MPYDATDLSPVTQKTIAKLNLERLRDFIGLLPDEAFNMSWWNKSCEAGWTRERMHPCNTVGCIGGWGEWLFGESGWYAHYIRAVPTLGLTQRQAQALFEPYVIDDYGWPNITRQQAMAALDNVIACGWPKWREAIKVK